MKTKGLDHSLLKTQTNREFKQRRQRGQRERQRHNSFRPPLNF